MSPVRRLFMSAGSAVLLLGVAPASTNAADGAAGRSTPHVAVSATRDVTEGARFAVTARLRDPRNARRVIFEYEETGLYSFQSITQWTRLKSFAAKGRRVVTAVVRADQAKEARFRAVVRYHGGRRPVVSRPVRVNYWHWQGLPSTYYRAGSSIDFVGFQMAGRDWNGWYMGAGASAESRYTMAGSCKELRATVGVTDRSADGSTGSVVLSTIAPGGAVHTVWTSPSLIPGRTVAVHAALPKPYRFSIYGQNTSTADGDINPPAAYPAVGDPEFLCHQD